MLSGGAIGFGMVIGWAGGFAGAHPVALACRLAAGLTVLLLLRLIGTGMTMSAAIGIVAGALGHEAFASAIRYRRRA